MRIEEARELHALGGRAAEIAAPYLPPPVGARGATLLTELVPAEWFTVVGTSEDVLRQGAVRIEFDDGREARVPFAEVHAAIERVAGLDYRAVGFDGVPLRIGTRVVLTPGKRGARLGTVHGYAEACKQPVVVVWDDAGAHAAGSKIRYHPRDLCRPPTEALLAAEIREVLHSGRAKHEAATGIHDLLNRVATFLETP